MRYCTQCGKELQDDAQFCVYCGTSANSEEANFTEEKEFLDTTHRFLKIERIGWIITGVMGLVLSGIFLLFTLLFFAGASGMVMESDPESAFGLGMGALVMIIYCLIFVPFAIIGLVCASRIKRHMNQMYTDFRPTAERCDSVGLIVLAAFFSTLALVFHIINFVRVKSNRQTVERIIHRQQGQ